MDMWIADVVGRMHVAGITGKRLAAECGYTESYLSTVLHGKKGDSNTQRRIYARVRENVPQSLAPKTSD